MSLFSFVQHSALKPKGVGPKPDILPDLLVSLSRIYRWADGFYFLPDVPGLVDFGFPDMPSGLLIWFVPDILPGLLV